MTAISRGCIQGGKGGVGDCGESAVDIYREKEAVGVWEESFVLTL